MRQAGDVVSIDSGLQVSIEFLSSGMNYSNVEGWASSMKEKYVFIQTDKAMYKPEQKVYFRAVALDRRLMPLRGTVNVIVEDAKNNRIKQWSNQTLDRGVFGSFIQLSDYVNFGDWQITFSGEGIPTTRKSFTVQQYVLPKYEVKMEFPPKNYWLYSNSDSAYRGKINAKYTFGKSVRGTATVKLASTGGCNYRYDSPQYYRRQGEPIPVLTFQVPLKGDGSADDGAFVLNGLNAIVNSGGSSYGDTSEPQVMMNSMCSMSLDVNVTEDLTGEVIRGEGSVILYNDPYNIKVHDSVQKTLKAGLPFTMRMQVTMPDDTPVAQGVDVKLEVYFWTINDTRTRYSVTCYSRYNRNNNDQPIPTANLVQTLTTDSMGMVSLEVTPPKDIESVLFKASLVSHPTVQNCDTRYPPRTSSKQSLSI